jgi:hypothetical protein
MSATAILANQVRYSDQYKLRRAELTVSWLELAFDRVIELLKIEPAEIAAGEEPAMPKGVFGTWY